MERRKTYFVCKIFLFYVCRRFAKLYVLYCIFGKVVGLSEVMVISVGLSEIMVVYLLV
jgi:hypothetical protein